MNTNESAPVEQADIDFANVLISGFRRTSGCYYAEAKDAGHWIAKEVARHRIACTPTADPLTVTADGSSLTFKDDYAKQIADAVDLDATPAAVDEGLVERAAQHVFSNSRKGTASINEYQRAADDAKMLAAYRDIITKALSILTPSIRAKALEDAAKVADEHNRKGEQSS